MGRIPIGFALAVTTVVAAWVAGGSSAHPDACHAARTCPADDHEYVWSGMSCVSEQAARRPEDQLPIDHAGRRYWCHVVVDRQMTPNPPQPSSQPAGCPVARADVRTLSDPAAAEVSPGTTVTTVASLAALSPPSTFARRAPGAERTRYQVRGRLVSVTGGTPSSELRVVLRDLVTPATVVVVLPAAACTANASAAIRGRMAAARAAFVDDCGGVAGKGSVRLSGTATVSGVGFFARSPSGSGNGFALAPGLRFSAVDCRRSGG